MSQTKKPAFMCPEDWDKLKRLMNLYGNGGEINSIYPVSAEVNTLNVYSGSGKFFFYYGNLSYQGKPVALPSVNQFDINLVDTKSVTWQSWNYLNDQTPEIPHSGCILGFLFNQHSSVNMNTHFDGYYVEFQ